MSKAIKTYNETISITGGGRELNRYTIQGELSREGNTIYRLLVQQNGILPRVEEYGIVADSDTEAIRQATEFINSQVEIIKSSVQSFLGSITRD